MIFILNEQVLNGTVTMSNVITGIEAKNFSEAIKKVKTFKSFTEGDVQIIDEKSNRFTFMILQKQTTWTVFCEMKNEELKIV